jgi:hypothetical protein
MFPYLVLLRMGFTMPGAIASPAVRSYRTISTLPAAPQSGSTCVQARMPLLSGLWRMCLRTNANSATSAVYFLLHFPSPHGARLLAGIPLYGARTFLYA